MFPAWQHGVATPASCRNAGYYTFFGLLPTITRLDYSAAMSAPNARVILTLRHFDGLSNSDCAAALGIEPKAASIRHVRAVARLHHPNIVQAYSAGRSGDFLWMAMELADGESADRHTFRSAEEIARFGIAVEEIRKTRERRAHSMKTRRWRERLP